jgi:hypothetical protein
MESLVQRGAGLAVAAACMTAAIWAAPAMAQHKAALAQQKLMGAWSLATVEVTNKAGAKESLLEGRDVKGLLMFDAHHFSLQVIAAYPKLASNDRRKTTPEENRAVAHGVLSYFGSYSLHAANDELAFHIQRSTFPNQNGRDLKVRVTALTAAELRYTVTARTSGGSTTYIWRRAR